jgi:hypothetical protein
VKYGVKFALLLFPLVLNAAAVADPPAWLRNAVAEKPAAFDSKTPAVYLLRESNVSVDESGKITTTERVVMRLLNRSGLSAAHAAKFYLRDTGKVKDLKAWSLSPTGESRRLPKERFPDVAAGDDALYEDIRARIVDASKECDPGGVFAYESVLEEKSIFTQLEWHFSDRLPARVSRFTLTLPAGWSARAVTINHAPIQQTESGGTQTWELRDLPFFEGEPASPAVESLRPRLAVSFFPAETGKANMGPSFALGGCFAVAERSA